MATRDESDMFLTFIREQAANLVTNHTLPDNKQQWRLKRREIRNKLVKALGGFPDIKCDLDPTLVGKLEFEGYTIEKVVIQTIPGVQLTANVYCPDGEGPFPAVLCVHGHWKGAKQDPTVQSRCIGLAKLGFVAMAVDACGAGERGVEEALGEYHGEMTAATLYATGRNLAGIQVYENMRCADYLESRTDVDGEKLAITGTSGGGNQTMYAGALEERFKAVIPVCSVGNYQAYLGVACCMCELVPGALTFTEEWGVLGLIAPRALMVINATRDGIQFSVAEAKKSLAGAEVVFAKVGKPQNVTHVIVDSNHDYNQPMREAMYGWVTLHLKNEGDGSPIAEPDLTPVDRNQLRCYPEGHRPAGFVTLPMLAKRFATQLNRRQIKPIHLEHWEADRVAKLGVIRRHVGRHGNQVKVYDGVALSRTDKGNSIYFEVEPEAGVRCGFRWNKGAGQELIIATALDGEALSQEERKWCADNGIDVLEVILRATGKYGPAVNRIGAALDHNAAQWSAWIGRPLAGQWVKDLQVAIGWVVAAYEKVPTVSLVTRGAAIVPGVLTTGLQSRIKRFVALDAPLTLASDRRYGAGQIGAILPGMLSDLGDIGQLVSLVAPRPTWIVAGKNMQGEDLDRKLLIESLAYAASIYKMNQSRELHVMMADGRKNWLRRVFMP
ncbi:MAG: prolyl oligopeptidase family serine peptidase [Planctomycetaceae bacterium]|jgi:hypothetical protein|nr:prolyl oligopeptidase family serine peptidase [Planctomycetaceae bacterium]MBT5885651.1 prolyl oligopeptidase family serine peptidase [Planctomycetaceae bacterium]